MSLSEASLGRKSLFKLLGGIATRVNCDVLGEHIRLVILDGVYVQNQSATARLLFRFDRGQFIRTEELYRKLISEKFEISLGDIRTDLLPITFTHFATICRHK